MDRISELAIAYRTGDLPALAELLELLQPMIRTIVGKALKRGLAAHLEVADIGQQAHLAVIDLALRWNPTGGAFVAYANASLPFMLMRWQMLESPARRSKHVRVDSRDHFTVCRIADFGGHHAA